MIVASDIREKTFLGNVGMNSVTKEDSGFNTYFNLVRIMDVVSLSSLKSVLAQAFPSSGEMSGPPFTILVVIFPFL